MGKYKVDDYEVIYLPKNLNVEQLMNVHPPELKEYAKNREKAIERVQVILGQILGRRIIDKRLDGDDFVNLHTTILEYYVTGYKQILTWAKVVGVIEINESYQADVYSRAYRFTKEYRQYHACRTAYIYDKTLVKKIRSKRINKNSVKTLPKLYEYLTNLTIDQGHAYDIMNEVFEEGLKRSYNEKKVESILERRFYFKRDKHVGRLHTSVVGLKRELRQALRYDEQELINVDIKNSQPYFSTALLTAHGYETLGVSNILKRYDSKIDLSYIEDSLDGYDSGYMESVLSGQLYDKMASELNIERKDAKNLVFDILFSPPSWNTKHKDLFIKHYEREWKLFEHINSRFKQTAKQGRKSSDPSNTLALALQRVESTVFLDYIVPRILEQYPGLPIWTIHDSILTLKGEEQLVENLIKEVCTELLGFHPTLECQ